MNNNDFISKFLSVRAGTVLRRAGIITVQQFLDTIQNYGLSSLSEGDYYFGRNGPSLRQAGRKTWEEYTNFLDGIGFDWKRYIIPAHYYKPETKFEFELNINHKIDELLKLLNEYKKLHEK